MTRRSARFASSTCSRSLHARSPATSASPWRSSPKRPRWSARALQWAISRCGSDEHERRTSPAHGPRSPSVGGDLFHLTHLAPARFRAYPSAHNSTMGGKLPVAHLDLAGPFARRDDWAHVSQESLGAMTATTTASTRQGTRSRRGSSTGPSAAAADTDTDKLARRPSILQSVRGRLRHSQSASSISSVGSSAPTIGAASASSRRFKAPPHLGSPVNVTRESSKLDVDFSSVGRDHAPKQSESRLSVPRVIR